MRQITIARSNWKHLDIHAYQWLLVQDRVWLHSPRSSLGDPKYKHTSSQTQGDTTGPGISTDRGQAEQDTGAPKHQSRGFLESSGGRGGAKCQAISPSLASYLASGQYQHSPLKPLFPLKASGLPLAFQTTSPLPVSRFYTKARQ